MIIPWHIRLLLLTSHFLGNHLTLNQNLHLNQDHFPLSQNHIPLSQVQNSIPLIHLTIPVIHLPKFSGKNKGQSPLSHPICNYCKQSGLIISECVALKRKREKEKQESPKPTGLTSLRSSIQDGNPVSAKTSEADSVMEIYEPFLSDGFVSLNSDSAQSTPIKILRDTGASQSLILADTLPFSEKTSSGTSVLIQGVECGFVNVPLHNIYLSPDLVTGLVAVGIRPSLPFKGAHLLLGNDLAGDKVVVK